MPSVPKQMRFEVFKRDKFKCQYCGAEAPNVLLHADHIKPAADGGETSLLNLVTSCVGCNLGKGARPLTDDSALTKQRNQLDDLQERREQLEMMLAWHEGLRDLQGDTIQAAAAAWYRLAPGWAFNEYGLQCLGKDIRKFGLSAVLSAMQTSADQYLVINEDGVATRESWNAAVKKIPGICKYDQIRRDDPVGAELLHIRNMVAKRHGLYGRHHRIFLGALQRSVAQGKTVQELWGITHGFSDYHDAQDWADAVP